MLFGSPGDNLAWKYEDKFPHKKIGGKRLPLAATGIDFNRILLSA
jgi:hypothetical protein